MKFLYYFQISVKLVAPATGETPSGTATTTEAGYSVGTVQWSPGDSKFLGSTAYTATVTLTAGEGYTFTGLATAKIDGHDAATSGNTGSSVTLSYAFAATSAKIVSGISIKTQPGKLAYMHGDTLDLSGLEVTLDYNDGTSEDVGSSGFEGKNIETEPAEGEALLILSHNGKGIKVEYGDHLSAETSNLTVSCEEHNTETQFCDERDGKIYKWKLIEGTGGYSKVWMAENLNYAADGSKCYENTDSNCDTYGRLYNWATAMDNAASSDATPSGVQGVCPSGWHLPGDAEWTALTTAIGTNPGTKLKASSSLWTINTGTDDYGFSALPGGYGYSSGNFDDVGSGGCWWSSTQNDASYAWSRLMYGRISDVSSYNDLKGLYNSVRCVQD
jgi:uncharacterized protein (TIGR02145 family)